MTRYWITDSLQLGGVEQLLEVVRRRAGEGIERIQLREKHLSARELAHLTERVLAVAGSTRILVNDRLDIALAAGAHGVHLRARSVSPALLRPLAPPGFEIAVSCHSLAELQAAEAAGADFAVAGPVFSAGPEKAPPIGLETLREWCAATKLPVYALGGITADSLEACRDAGARGIAGIRLFQGY